MGTNEIVKFQEAFKLRRGIPKSLVFTAAMLLSATLLLAQNPAPSTVRTVSTTPASDDLNPCEIVEFTAIGKFINQLSVDPNQGGSFGLNVSINGLASVFAYVDDNQHTLTIRNLPSF